MENVVSVSQINNYIKNVFEAEIMLQNICVYGEISNFNISNGIAYFSIKDENSLLPCILFNAKDYSVKIGDMVIVRGSIYYYVKGGKLSFQAVSIENYGIGVLYEKFLQLKDELEKKGYYDILKKKQLPENIKRIGVVTSSTGAVIQDIIDVTQRRDSSIDIVIYPVKVQGVGAEFDIAKAINFFSDYNLVDVIIVARGGGSLEDLQPFNTKIVADAVFNCKKTLVSAIGHETDYTIIDFVSDLRAPTPSAAAELVVKDKKNQIKILLNTFINLTMKIENKITTYNSTLENLKFKVYNNLQNMYFIRENKLNLLMNNLNSNIEHKILKFENSLIVLDKIINSNNPVLIANKGYIKVYKENTIIKSSKSLNNKEMVNLNFIDGNVKAEIKEVKNEY